MKVLLLTFISLLSQSALATDIDLKSFRDNIKARSCMDLSGWQKDLDTVASGKIRSYELIEEVRKRCLNKWSQDQRSCLKPLIDYAAAREDFFNARQKQEEFFAKDWEKITDLCDIFPCTETKLDNGSTLKLSEPFPNWANTFLNCIRGQPLKPKDPACEKVKGWCAFEMPSRHHEGVIAEGSTIFFYDPKKQRFLLNAADSFGERDPNVEMLTVVEPKNADEPRRAVFSTLYSGLQMHPSNTSAQTGCWHCHASGAPRKISPVWGSIKSVDQKGVACMNEAMAKMGDFDTEHLWSNKGMGPGRGHGAGQSCTECHSGDWRDNASYEQRGKLLHLDVMNREIFAKMTSWNPTMPPNLTRDPEFRKAQEILNRVNALSDQDREKVYRHYVDTLRRLKKERGLSDEMGRDPAKNPEPTRKLLAARREAQLSGLALMPVVSAEERQLVSKVLESVDRRGVSDFLNMTEEDRRNLSFYLGGKRERCLTSSPAKKTVSESDTVR